MTVNKPLFEELLNNSSISEQLHQVIEETSELNKEICKYFRYKQNNVPEMLDEMGDVINTIESVLFALKVDMDVFNKTRHQKVKNHIKKRLQEK